MTIQELIYRRLRQEGMTHAGACATLGNLEHESAFRSNNVEDGRGFTDEAYTAAVDSGSYSRSQFIYDSIGYGLAQWTYNTRKALMYDYFKQRHKSIADFNTQMEFLVWEMKGYFQNIWRLLTRSDDLENCVHELLYKWENPAEKNNNMKNRLASARTYYSRFKDLPEKEVAPKSKWSEESAKEAALNLARSEIGYHEKATNSQLDDPNANSGAGNWTKYARDLDNISNFYNGKKNGYAWCDIFVDWLFVKTFGQTTGREMLCQPIASAGAGCLFSMQYFQQQGRFSNEPHVGDQIFFSYSAGEISHTGIVESITGNSVITIEGNTSEQVARRTYPFGSDKIVGYGTPRWNLVIGKDASPSDIPSSSQSVTYYKQGMRDPEVKHIQEQLIELGFNVGSDGADGDYGPNSADAVRAFQVANGLEVDGVVGPETKAKLDELTQKDIPSPLPDEDDPVDTGIKNHLDLGILSLDTEGPDVKLAQSALLCWGYSTIVTGIFGKEMQQKIMDFQRRKGLEATGIVDLETWKKLLEIQDRM